MGRAAQGRVSAPNRTAARADLYKALNVAQELLECALVFCRGHKAG